MNKDAERYLAEVPADHKALVEHLHARIITLHPCVNIDMLGNDAAGARLPTTREQDTFFT